LKILLRAGAQSSAEGAKQQQPRMDTD